VYVAVADLIPQLQRPLPPKETLSQLAWLGIGLGVVTLITRFLHH
jgi:zinc and cadmium transporter